MPRKFHVGMPDNAQREAILRVLLANENIDEELDYWALRYG
jgi:ATP-dependent Zn protease